MQSYCSGAEDGCNYAEVVVVCRRLRSNHDGCRSLKSWLVQEKEQGPLCSFDCVVFTKSALLFVCVNGER